MARDNMDDWIPEEYDSEVIQAVTASSAVEAVANRVPMKTSSKSVPRDGGTDVDVLGRGDQYKSGDGDDDAVTLTASKFGRAIVIAEEDLDDQKGLRDVIAVKQKSWATSYGKALDNCCLAVTSGGPFHSVYKELSGNLDDNIVQSSDPSYEDLSDVLALVEQGDYFDLGAMVVIASPSFRGSMRGVKDDNGNPIFIAGTAGTPDTLFNIPIKWSIGCRLSGDNKPSSKPSGNPLLVVANKNYLLLGVRSGPESMFSDGNTGALMMNDEAVLKMRARRGFALGFTEAAAVLEDTGSSS
jgi:HK97 family phage major capsid protein